MIDENERRWKELCRQATVELDTAKLNQLVRAITRLLEARQIPTVTKLAKWMI